MKLKGISIKVLKFILIIPLISFLVLPFVRSYNTKNSNVFLKNNFAISEISSDSKVNEIYEVSILESSVEPETIFLYSGDVIRFINSRSSNVTFKIGETVVELKPQKDYFSVFSNFGVTVVEIDAGKETLLPLKLQVNVK